MTNLGALPPEILEQIVQHLHVASDVTKLSQASRKVHEVIEKEGWRAFVAQRFPSIPVPPFWKDAAHALTTLSRNLDRRAFIAQEVEPHSSVYSLPSGNILERWERPRGQTMGYQAVLDTYEDHIASHWSSRKRVVAWGAGAELILSVAKSGPTERAKTMSPQKGNINTTQKSAHQKPVVSDTWVSYREKQHVEGRDDITTVNILKPQQQATVGQDVDDERAVVGRANGELSAVHMSLSTGKCRVRRYNTSNSSVRSSDISSGQSPLLASCLSDDRLVIYPLHSDREVIQPQGEASCLANSKRICRTWSTRFLSHDRLAIGMGPSNEIVKVFQVTNDGLTKNPLRCFQSGSKSPTSAYPIRQLPNSASHGPGVVDDLILSGNYDGTIRMHDLRSPRDFVSLIRDPVDDSAVFSLETVGRERIIAGSSHHSLLKIFDLRMAGGRAYDYQSVPAQPLTADHDQNDLFHESDRAHSSGFNVFVGQNRQIPSSRRRQPKESPIYSLSRPSPHSPMLYAGLENSVVSFNFTSAADHHPDPIFDSIIQRSRGAVDTLTTWFSTPPFALTLYEHMGSRNMRMLYQRNLGRHRSGLSVQAFEDCEPGYDERLSRISTSTRLSAARSNFSR